VVETGRKNPAIVVCAWYGKRVAKGLSSIQGKNLEIAKKKSGPPRCGKKGKKQPLSIARKGLALSMQHAVGSRTKKSRVRSMLTVTGSSKKSLDFGMREGVRGTKLGEKGKKASGTRCQFGRKPPKRNGGSGGLNTGGGRKKNPRAK